MSLPTAPLGRNGPLVNTVGFGLMGLHMFYGKPTPDEKCFALLDRALELGETFWDTSDLYGGNEAMLGRYFKSRPGAREKVYLCTKFGAYTKRKDGTYGSRTDPEYAKQAIDKSLKDLGVPYVDLYYVHRIDKEIPIEDTMDALVEIKNAGKIKAIGLSECSARTIERAHAVHPITAVQVEYSPFSLDIEHNGVKSTCERLGISIVAYSPLSRGILTGKIRSRSDFDETDSRLTMPRYSEANFDKNVQLVDWLNEEAVKKGITVGQLSLAWLVGQGTFPIPGTTRIEALEENVEAANVVLSNEELAELDKLIRSAEPLGTRYAVGQGGPLFEDTVERK